MRLDIGIASYENPMKLQRTLELIEHHSQSDWRCLIVDNASPDANVREVIDAALARNPRFEAQYNKKNKGYAGAVNDILKWADTEYVAYVDNDCHIQTTAWDLKMAHYLDTRLELGMVFSSRWGAYEIDRGPYVEVLWSIGCFWMLKRLAQDDVGLFDETLGHQEEVDFQTRLRLKGWKFCSAKDVVADHFATASSSAAAQQRIGQGVVKWMNKWEEYFCGKGQSYHSANVLRFEDWPVNTIYLEEYYKQFVPDLNANPETMNINGRAYDLLRVPRFKDFYTGRII